MQSIRARIGQGPEVFKLESSWRLIIQKILSIQAAPWITALTFLYGNLRDVDLVYAAVRLQLGVDPDHHDHTLRFLADLRSGKYNEKYFYFDVLAADWFFLGGALNTRHAPPTPHARLLGAWEHECARVYRREKRWPSLAEQRAFLGPNPPHQ